MGERASDKTDEVTAGDDAGFTLPGLRYLVTEAGEALLGEAEAAGETVAGVARLRKKHPPEAVHMALTMARQRQKAARKFGEIGPMWSPPEALEQASSLAVGRHKARRVALFFEGNPQTVILDACCGIGGDSISLATAAPVIAMDISAVRLVCLARNAAQFNGAHGIWPILADAAAPPVDFSRIGMFHIDPARRRAGRRHHAYEEMEPGPAVIERLLERVPAGAIKLSPGVDFSTLPAGHLELIGEDSSVVQAVLWTGRMADVVGGTSQRTATGIKRGKVFFSFTAKVEPLEGMIAPMDYLGEVDPAIHRAGLAPALARQLHAHAVNADGGTLTAAGEFRHPAVAGFRHVATIRYAEKPLCALLAALPRIEPGAIEVKSRGGLDIDTDRLQRVLAAGCDQRYTILLYEAKEGIMASVAVRMRV